jgi:guanylate kinase
VKWKKFESWCRILSKGILFIVSAPAGTGKTTLVNLLVKNNSSIVRSVSYTTRNPRPEEKEGLDYFFIDNQEFKERINRNEFLEYVEVFGNYYGTSKEFVKVQLEKGMHVVLVIDTQGALLLKDKISAVFIFITAPSFDVLKKRLFERKTENSLIIEQRLLWAEQELQMLKYYDYHIVNDDLQISYDILRSIVVAEEHKARRNLC